MKTRVVKQGDPSSYFKYHVEVWDGESWRYGNGLHRQWTAVRRAKKLAKKTWEQDAVVWESESP